MKIGENILTLVAKPQDRLNALLSVIAGAQSTLKMTYYTFAGDSIGRQVVAALAKAAERGVAITLLVDSFGSTETPDALFEPLRAAGGDVRYFGARWSMRYLVRNHQKITVADDATALVGGYNISMDDFAEPDKNGWLDTGAVIQGPAASVLAQYMDRLIHLTDHGRVNWRRRKGQDFPCSLCGQHPDRAFREQLAGLHLVVPAGVDLADPRPATGKGDAKGRIGLGRGAPRPVIPVPPAGPWHRSGCRDAHAPP